LELLAPCSVFGVRAMAEVPAVAELADIRIQLLAVDLGIDRDGFQGVA
jgi:hypothetical protein